MSLRHTDGSNRWSCQRPHSGLASSRWPLVAQPEDVLAQTKDRCNSNGQSDTRQVEPPSERSPRHPRTQPLVVDVTQYTNPHLTKHLNKDDENITLQELAHVVRLSKYQERKRANTRVRLQRSLISTALSARLTRCGDIANRNLVDSVRKDDKDGFVMLYNAIQDIRKSCDEMRRYAFLDPDIEPLSSPTLGSSESLDTPTSSVVGVAPLRSITPFLHEISATSRDTILDFLSELRTNPDYLATRICALSSSELNAFLSFHKGMEPVESVLPYHGRSASRQHAGVSTSRSNSSSDIERLLSFQRHDPLSILIHYCFANPAGPDSTEDQRRTDIWATVLARLIQQPKSSSEHFLISVLNIWTGMRDWSGRSNMEWYLMKILEEGVFILDRAEDQHGTRFNLSDWNSSDEAAAQEFYDRAVQGLFELVDDEDATGIPEGLLELGNAILKKLDNKYVENTSRWLVWRCLFFVFLLGVIVHPESYGMLAEYHITPYAREKILKKVAMKAHEYVSSMWSGKPSATCVPAEVPPQIKGHVERILSRFQGSRSKNSSAKLLPARSITSLRETVEVHPYLVLSPSDLATLANALFPERRPLSSMSNTLRSGAASISGLSAISQQVYAPTSRNNNLETASIISTSFSSVVSDGTTAPREGSQDGQPHTPSQRHSPSSADPDAQRRLNLYEDDGYRLRLAMHELRQNLGPEAVKGGCHPCAERWIVLFLSSDGKKLSTSMTYDPEDEGDDDDNSSSTDTDEDEDTQGPELDKGYHQIRDAILRLVEEFEIPRNLETEGDCAPQLTNRASRLRRYKSKNKIITTENSVSNRNLYRTDDGKSRPKNASSGDSAASDVATRVAREEDGEGEPVLIKMLRAASSQSKAQADFVSAHLYWKTLKNLCALESPSLRANGFAVLINIFSRGPRDSLRRSAGAIEEYDAWLIWLKQSQERHEGLIDRMMRRVRAMRDKMWFVTDVRNSKEYGHSRDICQALKTMGMPRRWSSMQRSRANVSRAPGSSYLYRTESQIMDLLAASEEQGGPNKLSDDQAEMTSSWLQKYGIENFCQGEERIHRFCCEVDKCVSKLVGETIREAPVLWSSDLYKREKVVYDRRRARERDQSWSGDDTASILSDSERRFGSPSSRPSRMLRESDRGRFPNSPNASQHALDMSRINFARPTASLSDVVENQDSFEKSPPVNTVDSVSTFWSPFQPVMTPGSGVSKAYSPTTSLTNLSTTFSGPLHHATLPSSSSVSTGRPGTSASSNETIFQQQAEDEKSRFLNELRKTLTSLLLSDLGSQVLARGSETDAWFHGLGQQCIDRRDAFDRYARRRTEKKDKEVGSRSSTRPRVIEKKKSFRNLRNAGDSASERSPDGPLAGVADDAGSSGTGNGHKAKEAATDFPFKKAYRRLLNMFSVNPNPFAKLNALNELENLIIASLMWHSSRKLRANRSDAGSSTASDRGPNNRQTSLDGTIDNVRERRSQAIQSAFHSAGYGHQPRQANAETKSIVSSGSASTDAITSELQRLFRDAEIRPKSLFRDLQLIAAFVPSTVLDKPERGKAFWNAGLAALKLKSEVCRTMMEMADEVVGAHSHTRGSVNENHALPEAKTSATGTPPPASSVYTLDDAGRMWSITAKEGYPTAQRELALFSLSNPEFVERTTLPLSKPREVFKQTVMERYGRNERTRGNCGVTGPAGLANAGLNTRAMGSAIAAGDGPALSGKDGDVKNDVGLMCLAVHWMKAAEQGGDDLATRFLRQNEFMDMG
ncbi:uncharacterized protein MAM_06484 [Metarhizium album ARSEF 1941]|uniref:Uncharacterized protein n=1 Tax=Metarhizium album (strain ARSEF 1941) TaxID=1081103 RepID=A0A0B2WNS1_METAS|nr:uncharacterized protein MAM_06484 [Metarhizium album ARSEF 1941]KHN95643.1 hypothetical protein MAM_06484 [Metarhizium album ARSEF 1941]